jgi:signal transduction histidine kinase
MITGYATVENAVEAMKNGAYDFIQKPFNMDEVIALLEKALEKSELKTLIALYESSKAIFSSLKLEKLFPIMINLLKNVIRADEIALLLFDHQGQLYLAAASFSLVYYPYQGSFTSLAERLYASDQLLDSPVIFKPPMADEPVLKGLFRDSEMKSLAAYPIKIKNKNLGILMVARTKNHSEFSVSDIRNLSIFVSQIAQSIDNTKLYEKLEIKISELESAHRQLEQSRRQVVLVEKMSAVGQVAASLVNQLSVPVESVNTQAEKIAKRKALPEEIKEAVKKIKDGSERCKEVIDNLKVFSSYHKANPRPEDINKAVSEALELVEYEFQNDNIRIAKDLAADMPMTNVDFNQIKQVLLNLLINAQQSFGEEQERRQAEKIVTIKTSSAEGQVYIEVNDNGSGMDPKIIEKIFAPFFTTKDPKKNIGLGLSISYSIIEQHNGKIHVKSMPREGSSFLINIPVSVKPA